MISWIRSVIASLLCHHEWKIESDGPHNMDGRLYGHYYDLRCKKCGDMNKKTFS
jgi:hypothetical protein